jgi:tetratricopeptide (TPR) repeat protein
VLFQTVLLALSVAAQAPWDGAPFQGDPAAIQKAAAALPPHKDSDVDILLEEERIDYDAQRRMTYTYRLVFRPLTREAANSWATFAFSWSPWFQERPEIRARIISPSGELHTLDPATLSESGLTDQEAHFFTDRRLLRGPLPALEPGAVVEEQAIVRDTAPFFDAGSIYRSPVGRRGLPVRCQRLQISAPIGLPLAWRAAGGAQGKPQESQTGGLHTLAWEWRELAKLPAPEPYSAPDLPLGPRIAVSTSASWRAVAARYTAVVEQQLAGEELKSTVAGVVTPGDAPEVAAQKLLDWVSARVRYTGLELGQASIVPAKPSAVLQRRYGDCKDLALLLTGLLRAAGYSASLALLRTAWDEVDPALPGFGLFDHAIVHLSGAKPIFIDATAPSTPVGELPTTDQGRLALVATPNTDRLVATPRAGAAENVLLGSREILLAETGRARAIQAYTMRGAFASRFRAWRRQRSDTPENPTAEDTQRTLEILDAQKVVSIALDGLERAGRSATIRREALGSEWGITNGDTAEAVVSSRPMFEDLPDFFLPPREKTRAAPLAERRTDVWIGEPFSSELRYRVVPPPGYRARQLPADEQHTWGPIQFQSTFSEAPPGEVTVVYRLELEGGPVPALQAKALQEAMVRYLSADPAKIGFRRVSAELLDQGKGKEAIEELRRLCKLHPTEARHQNDLAMALLRLRMTAAARREARRAVELEPKSEWAHRVLAQALVTDGFGRFLGAGCDLAGAVAERRRAAELEPTPINRAGLAALLTHGAHCAHYAPDARLGEAISIYKSLHEAKSTDSDPAYLETLIADGRFSEARALAGEVRPGAERSATLLTAAAIDGAQAVERVASGIAPEERGRAIQSARLALLRRRLYPAAATLVRSASDGMSTSAQLQQDAALLARLRRSEEIPVKEGDPAALPRLLYRAAMSSDPLRNLAPLIHRDPSYSRRELDDFIAAFSQGSRGNVELPAATLLDVIESLLQVKVEGDPATAVSLQMVLPWRAPFQLVALRQDGELRLVANVSPGLLAGEARRRAEEGDLASARRLLDLAYRLPSPPARSFAQYWGYGQTADATELISVAALVEGSEFPDPIPFLVNLRKNVRGAGQRAHIDWVLARSYRKAQRWGDALTAADRVLASGNYDPDTYALRAEALVELGRPEDLQTGSLPWSKAARDDPAALRAMARVALRAGEGAVAIQQYRRLIELGEARQPDYVNLARAGLLAPALPSDALAMARKAAAANDAAPELILALALVHAASGEPTEAAQAMLKALRSDATEPSAIEWLLLGKIAEDYGLLEDAAAAYAKLPPPKERDLSTTEAIGRAWAARLRAN